MDLIDKSVTTPDNQGERAVSNLVLRDGRVTVTTLIPSDDPCKFGGSGWIMVIDAADGSQLDFSALDSNDDNKFNTDDMIDINGDGEGDHYASSAMKCTGICTTPAQIDSGDATYNASGKTDLDENDNAVDIYKAKLDALVNKRLNWRELK